jgi:site-specific recombinase XerD
MRAELESFLIYLATERGLSENYQLSTRISLESFVQWLERKKIGEAAVEKLLAAGEPLPDVNVRAADVTRENISDLKSASVSRLRRSSSSSLPSRFSSAGSLNPKPSSGIRLRCSPFRVLSGICRKR